LCPKWLFWVGETALEGGQRGAVKRYNTIDADDWWHLLLAPSVC